MKFKGNTKWIFLAQPIRVSKCCGAVVLWLLHSQIISFFVQHQSRTKCGFAPFPYLQPRKHENFSRSKIFNFFYKVIVTIIREQTIFFQVQIKYVGHFTCESNNPSRAAYSGNHTSSWPRLIENTFRRLQNQTHRVKTLSTTRFTQFLDWIFLKIST